MAAPESPRTAEALERLAQGVAALVTSRAWQAYLDTARRFHNYSFTNILLIRAQVPEATRVAGFQAWKALGRTVRRGEHAIWILAPLTRRLAAEEEDDPAEKVRVIMGFRAVSVFDVSQTDGEPLAELPCHRLSGDDPTGSYDRLRRFAHGLGYTVEEDYLPGEMNGDCNFALRRLRIEVRNDELLTAKSLPRVGHVLPHDGFPGSRSWLSWRPRASPPSCAMGSVWTAPATRSGTLPTGRAAATGPWPASRPRAGGSSRQRGRSLTAWPLSRRRRRHDLGGDHSMSSLERSIHSPRPRAFPLASATVHGNEAVR